MSPFTPKLTAAQVAAIRAALAQGTATYSALGRQYGVTRQAITRIAQGQTWRDHDATDRLTDQTDELVWPGEPGRPTGE